MDVPYRLIYSPVLLLSALLLVTSARTSINLEARGAAPKDKKLTAPVPLVWPLPPEQPRVRYVSTLHGVSDFAKKPSKWKALLLGNDERPQLSDTMIKP